MGERWPDIALLVFRTYSGNDSPDSDNEPDSPGRRSPSPCVHVTCRGSFGSGVAGSRGHCLRPMVCGLNLIHTEG